MAQNDRLFQLIKSLTPNEKSYFAKFARVNNRKEERPDYQKLFEAIEVQDVYDETSLKEMPFLKNQSLSVKKNQLTDKILEVLAIMYAGKTGEAQLKRSLTYMPILFQRKQYEEMRKQIISAKKKANEVEAFHLLLELLHWEKNLIWKQTEKKNQMEKVMEEESLCFRQLQNQLNYKNIKIKIKAFTRKKAVDTSNLETIELLLQDDLLKDDIEFLSRGDERNYHQIKAIYYRLKKDAKSALKHVEALVNIYETDLKKVEKGEYKQALCDYLVVCDAAQDFEKFPTVLQKIETIYKDKIDDIRTFNTVNFLRLRYYLNKGNWEVVEDIVQKVAERWEELCEVIHDGRQLAYCFNFMMFYWVTQQYEDVEDWLLRILTYEKTKRRQDILLATRLFQLIFYYEYQKQGYQLPKDFDWENKIEATRKTLKNNNQLHEFQDSIIQACRQINRAKNAKEETTIIQNLHKSLKKTAKKHEQTLCFNEILTWSGTLYAFIKS